VQEVEGLVLTTPGGGAIEATLLTEVCACKPAENNINTAAKAAAVVCRNLSVFSADESLERADVANDMDSARVWYLPPASTRLRIRNKYYTRILVAVDILQQLPRTIGSSDFQKNDETVT
jgi:hypothetical protein